MVRFSFSKILMVAMMSVIMSCVFHTGSLMVSAFAEQDEGVRTLEVNEVKEEGEEGPEKISLTEVEKARELTAERIYWLAGLWALIFLAIILIRMQLKDDDELYRGGYYSKDLD
jgi:hypothetical protein